MIEARKVITIDGPAASGKSSTAQWVANKVGFRHVDSGSLYRALTAASVRAGTDASAWDATSVLEHAPRISIRPEGSAFVTLIDGASVEDEIRGGAVTASVSLVARMAAVRSWVNEQVRRAALEHDIVVDGRDMGTAVFPDAALKIFLIADPWERARRRLTQRLERRPTDDEVAEETQALVQRDAKDATQSAQAKDAVVLDTTYLTQEQQVERIVALAHTL